MSSQQTTEPAKVIRAALEESCRIRNTMLGDPAILEKIEKAASMLAGSVAAGGTIYACGNGGSSNDAMHLVEELVARYKRERPGIKAMHFMDAAVLTCWSNDYSFETVFARQAETFCGKNDILVALSTSGNSTNVIEGVKACKSKGGKTIALLGKDGGRLSTLADLSIVVPSNETERIQEVHITLIHLFCELLESR